MACPNLGWKLTIFYEYIHQRSGAEYQSTFNHLLQHQARALHPKGHCDCYTNSITPYFILGMY